MPWPGEDRSDNDGAAEENMSLAWRTGRMFGRTIFVLELLFKLVSAAQTVGQRGMQTRQVLREPTA